jgi:hypothetical protein
LELSEKLLESHKTLTKTNGSILVAVLFFCMYLVQRAFSVIGREPALLLTAGDKQWDYFGLELSYKTLTYLWPLLLGALCLGFSLLTSKQIFTLSLLKKELPLLTSDQLYCLDPYLITPDRVHFRGIHGIYALLAQAPVIANGFHLISVLGALFVFLFSPRFAILTTTYGIEVIFTTIGVLLSSAFGFWAALRFATAMHAINHEYRERQLAQDVNVK